MLSIYLIRYFYLEYIKLSQLKDKIKRTIKRHPNFKVGEGSKWTFLQRSFRDDQLACEEVSDTISHQGNADHSPRETPRYTASLAGIGKADTDSVARKRRKGDPQILLLALSGGSCFGDPSGTFPNG